MAVATFDTLKFADTLKTAGVPPQQAEAQAVAFGVGVTVGVGIPVRLFLFRGPI